MAIQSSYLSYVPLFSPALERGGYKMDLDLQFKRVMMVGLAALALFVAACGCARLSMSRYLCTAGILLLTTIPLDIWLTSRASRHRAVDAFIQSARPSNRLTLDIVSDMATLKLALKKNVDLYKPTEFDDEAGLIKKSYLAPFDNFKLVIDQGIDLKRHPSSRLGSNVVTSLFEDFLMIEDIHSDLRKLAYLFDAMKRQNIQPSDFTAEEQACFWMTVGSLEAMKFLKDFGFDPNVRGKNGVTPLQELKAIRNVTQAQLSHPIQGGQLGRYDVINLIRFNASDSAELLQKLEQRIGALQACGAI